MSQHFIDFEMLDFSDAKSGFTVYVGAITAISLPGFLSQLNNLRTALDGITRGTIRRERWIGDETMLSSIPPLDSMAQREIKWRVDYSGGMTYLPAEVTIATPDLSLLDPDQSGHIDYSLPAVAAFITAFESLVRMPYDAGESCIIDRIMLVGGNL